MIEQNTLPMTTRVTTEELDLLEFLLEDEGIELSQTQPILAKNNHGDLPLSFAQQRLWFLDQLEPNNPAYNIPAAVRLSGSLNVAALERTINEIVRRHEVLRTIFVTTEGQPTQLVTARQPRALEVINLSGLSRPEREAETQARIAAEARLPFDLSRGPLLRAHLLRLAQDEHVLLLTMHHIVSDGWSAGVLVRETAALYEAYAKDRESPLAELPIQYADYAQWQREWLQGPLLDEQLRYWRGQLAGAPGVLELPTDRPRPATQSFRGARLPFALSPEVSEELQALSRREGATLFMTLLAAWQVLLSRYSRQTDICVGTPIAGRTRSEVEGLIGFFVNTLALRADLSGDPPFTAALRRVKEVCLGAYAHQDVPFEKLVEELRPERSLTHTPLFQVCFVLQTASLPSLDLQGLKLRPLETESLTSKFDLTLVVSERNGALEGVIEYSADLFEAETVHSMLRHFQTLVGAIASDPARRLSRLSLLTSQERRRLLIERNEMIKDDPPLLCLHESFERQAELRPEYVAVACEAERLTYRELNQKANRLARHLRTLGVGAETRVALLMERSVDMVVALLAVLKAGGAYLPLDPQYPHERLSFMLSDSGADVALTQTALRGTLPESAAQVVEVDGEWPRISEQSGENLERAPEAGNLAYVIYTSGSTGRPKGVMVTHANVARLLSATRRWFEFCERDVWTMFHSYAFDFSVWEVWGALLHGGRLEVTPFWVSRTPESFYELLETKGVTVLNQTPSAFRQLTRVAEARAAAARESGAGAERGLSLRYVIFGGEALEPQSLEGWMKWYGDQRPRLINMYGITETTVHVTYREMVAADVAGAVGSVIGERIGDLQLYLLDEWMEVVPEGVTGEIYVGGEGLARGYLNRPELTAERFLPHPFGEEKGARLYKTGDLGRYLADGELEYVGRADEQVKIRGFRIELGEIEAALMQHASVQEAIVSVREDLPGEKRLVAYVVRREGKETSGKELRGYLMERLPDYMTPSALVMVEELPLTPNGKVDRRALPAPDAIGDEREGAYVAPRTPMEETLAEIWREVLGLKQVGVKDNFFELGGDSIRSVRILALAKERGLQISLQQLFLHQTISALAGEIETTDSRATIKVEDAPFCLITREDRVKIPDGVEDAYPLAKLQTGMLFHMELMPESPLYHNVNSWPLRTIFDGDALQEATNNVVARHPALRTSFDLTTYSEPLQLAHREAFLPVGISDLRGLTSPEQEGAIAAYVESEKQRRFDMSRPPLLRFHVHRLTDDVFQFTLTEFHPILDGWSLQSTLTEIFTKYFALLKGQALPYEPPLHATYREYIGLERLALESIEHQNFWNRQLSDCQPARAPRWPASYRGAVTSRIRRQRIRPSAEVLEGLQNLARKAAVPLKSVLLAAHLKVMNLISGQTDVLTGLVTNGRPEEIDGEQVRGLFLNTVPFRLELSSTTWLELAQRAFEAERTMLPFRRYPLAALQENRESLFETLFNYIHFHMLEGVLGSGQIEAGAVGNRASEETNFTIDASFSLSPVSSQLTLTLDCDATQLCDEQIEAFGKYYQNVLAAMAAEPSARHDARCFLTPEEQCRLLLEWNETAAAYERDSTIVELFERQAERTPEEIAVIFEEEQLNYRELNERANQLAHHLRGLGVGPEALVALCLERSVEMIVGMLGILKSGAAYAPLDPTYPADRLAFMLDDSNASVILTQQRLAGVLPQRSRRVLCLDTEWESIAGASVENPVNTGHSANLAYLIYTSGSTGKPKGVLVTHQNLAHSIQARVAYYREQITSFLLLPSFAFDSSVAVIFWTLCKGGALIIPRDGDQREPRHLAKLIARRRVSHLLGLPSFYALLLSQSSLDELSSLRTVIVAGEACPNGLVKQHRQALPQTVLYNEYGPTEGTVWSAVYNCSLESIDTQIPIGRPIANMRAYVLDRSGWPAPPGAAGELHIGGAGLSRGYLNRPELTAEKFIPDPFGGEAGARLYRTGDLARFLPTGEIEFLGRIDRQVKIRGYRIELGEIEVALNEHAAVRETVVVAQDDVAGEKQLIAYVVARQEPAVNAGQLRAFLKERLPGYMAPTAFILVEALPLTPSGKIDRRTLSLSAGAASRTDSQPGLENTYTAPRNETEQILADIWQRLLGVKRVGVHDNFFELGGHSLIAVQIVSCVRDALLVDLTMRNLFESPTINELGILILQKQADRTDAETLAQMLAELDELPELNSHQLL